jgi:probable F420-dependent oxidoreductase
LEHVRQIRFGVEMMGPFAGMTWMDSVRELEDLGYDTLFVPDHLDEGFGPLTAMASAAIVSRTLKLAPAVLAADFRHPAILAKELSSIDQLSEGRLEVGIGAGYQVNDYRGAGVTMDPPGVRVDRMIEHVAVLRGLFSGEPYSFAGEHYCIDDLVCVPPPYRPGGPPIMIAGGGIRMLSFAGANADIVGVNVLLPSSATRVRSAPDALPSKVDEKIGWVRQAAGERFDELILHSWVRYAELTDRGLRTLTPLAERLGTSVEEIRAAPTVLIGTADEIVGQVTDQFERWGFSYYTLQQPAARGFAPVVRHFRDLRPPGQSL